MKYFFSKAFPFNTFHSISMATRRKKTFPAGTFIPTPQRMIAIIQLCLALSLLLWHFAQPFMGEYFNLRSRMLLYEYVMGTSQALKNHKSDTHHSERQMRRFQRLPVQQQEFLKQKYQQLNDYANRPILKKFQDGIQHLIRDIPPFELAWIFFSIAISILLLLKKEGARHAVWLIPAIALAYGVDNQLTGKEREFSPDFNLFPSEQKIIQHHLKEPLAKGTFQQKKQLEEGWKNYLLENWLSGHPPLEKAFAHEDAEFNFTLARLQALAPQPITEWVNRFHEKSSLPPLILYFVWNLIFGWVASRLIKKNKKKRAIVEKLAHIFLNGQS